MIKFQRYPHVKEFIEYYLEKLSCPEIAKILSTGVNNEKEAEFLSRFIWKMVDEMSSNCDDKIEVFGQIDNSDVYPDIQYEITAHLYEKGYMNVWDRVRDDEN